MEEEGRHGQFSRDSFPTTRWTAVAQLRHGDTLAARKALESLCKVYWPSLYAFLRRQGHSPDDSADLTQGFFLHVITNEIILRANQDKGKLRTFLLASLKHYMANVQRAATRQKRGGASGVLSIDTEEAERMLAAELVDKCSPDMAYDRTWVMTLLRQVMARLEGEFAREGKAEMFAVLAPYVVEGVEKNGYAEASTKLGLSEGALRVQVHRLRVRYRDTLLREVADTVGEADDMEGEVAHLLGVFQP